MLAYVICEPAYRDFETGEPLYWLELVGLWTRCYRDR
jgi:hypothetical protein